MKGPIRSAVLATLILVLAIPIPLTAESLALTGNFYNQDFQLSPGEDSADVEAYVLVINTNDIPVRVLITTEAPDDVSLTLTDYDFLLEAGGQKRLDIIIEVGSQVAIGTYSIAVTASIFHDSDGIQAVGGTRQRASLNVVKATPSIPASSNADDSISNGSSLLIVLGSIGGGLALLAGVFLWIRKNTRWFHHSDNSAHQ